MSKLEDITKGAGIGLCVGILSGITANVIEASTLVPVINTYFTNTNSSYYHPRRLYEDPPITMYRNDPVPGTIRIEDLAFNGFILGALGGALGGTVGGAIGSTVGKNTTESSVIGGVVGGVVGANIMDIKFLLNIIWYDSKNE